MFIKKRLLLVFLIVIVALSYGFSSFAAEKQELIIAFGTEIVTFDMHNYRGTMDIIAGRPVYEALVDFGKDHNIVPCLATSWNQIDTLTWDFKLREGVKFHDGTTFNADAVKINFERKKDSGSTASVSFVDEIEIIDDYTIRFHLNKEYGPILNCFALGTAIIVSPSYLENTSKEEIGNHAVGTGPFILQEFSPGIRTVYVKNQDYWGEPAKLDRIEIRAIPEDGTRVMALRSGEVDVIENPSPNDIPSIERDKNLYVYQSPKDRTLFIGFNLTDEIVGGDEEKSKAIREAIAFAINKKEIVDYVLEGLGYVADTGFIPQTMSQGFHDPDLERDFDVEKAKAILKEAGIEEGTGIEFTVTRARYLKDTAIAEVIQQQVGNIGLKLKINVMDYGPFVNYVQGLESQMFQQGYGWPAGEPHEVLFDLFHSEGARNRLAFYNEEFDNLIDTAVETVDLKERMGLYNQAYKILFDKVGVIPLLHYQNIFAANNKVKDFYAAPGEQIYFEGIYIE